MPKPKDKIKPILPLPEGIRIGERPQGIEFMTRGRERWLAVIQTLESLDPSATIQIDVSGCSKTKIQGMKSGIKRMAQQLSYKLQIKFCVQGNVLHLWSN